MAGRGVGPPHRGKTEVMAVSLMRVGILLGGFLSAGVVSMGLGSNLPESASPGGRRTDDLLLLAALAAAVAPLVLGLVLGLRVRPPDMARRAGLLLMPLGFLGALGWGLYVWTWFGPAPEPPSAQALADTQGLATFAAAWLVMGIGGLLMWRAKERLARGVLPGAMVLFVAAPFVTARAGCASLGSIMAMLGVPPLLLLGCALAIVLRFGPQHREERGSTAMALLRVGFSLGSAFTGLFVGAGLGSLLAQFTGGG